MTLRHLSLMLLLLPAALAGSQATSRLDLRVTARGAGTSGTVVDVTVTVGSGDRAVAGERLRLHATLSSEDGEVDVLDAEVAVRGDGTATVSREWPPGRYRLDVAAVSLDGSFVGLASAAFEVPAVRTPAGPAPTQPAAASITPPQRDALHFIPPPHRGGLEGFRAEVAVPGGTETVEFYLDDELVERRRQPPWSVWVSTTAIVRRGTLRAVALDAAGRYLGEDAIAVIGSAAGSGLAILAAPDTAAAGATRRITVAVTDRRDFRRLSLSLDDRVVAQWAACPCVAEVPRSDLDHATALIAELVGIDGRHSVEIRETGGGFHGAVDVDVVELQVRVVDSHHVPVVDLEPDEISVFEDGREVAVEGVETSANLPLSVVIAVDTSSSMLPIFEQVRDAVAGFAENLLTDRDRAALLRFSGHAELLVPWSDDPGDIRRGLAGIAPQSSTAMNDAVIQSLIQLRGVRSRKAVVLLTDGEDTSSYSSFADARWFASSIRVPIFCISLRAADGFSNPKYTDPDRVRARHILATLAESSGGRAYFRIDADRLPAIYEDISRALRSQYVVWFRRRPDLPSDRLHSIQVKVSRPHVKVRTISGYYPAG